MKKIHKNFYALCLVLIFFAGVLFGCVSDKEENPEDRDKLNIITTVFSIYDWTGNIGKEQANITFLLEKTADIHSFQPTVRDISAISRCDVFIYIGGESDSWVSEVLSQAANKDMRVINLLEVLGESARAEEIKEGMQHDHHHRHAEDFADEHIWLSLKNAEVLVTHIAQQLGAADEKNKEVYLENSRIYVEKLSSLEKDYEDFLSSESLSSHRTLIFADRFPFIYLTEDYSINYFAAFPGCSSETKASANTITFLANKADEAGVDCLIIIEGSSQKIAKTVNRASENKNREILMLNSLESVSKKQLREGCNYLDVMEKNLEVLKKALK